MGKRILYTSQHKTSMAIFISDKTGFFKKNARAVKQEKISQYT